MDDYLEWLDETGLEDTDDNRGWFECPEDERANYISEHPDWWSDF
jgi:hypothetical protein